MTWAIFVDSANSISLYPNWDLKQPDKKIESIHRPRSGTQYRYKWGYYSEFKFSVDFVNSRDASIINSWWSTNTELLFMDEDTTKVYSVVFQNSDQPLTTRNKPLLDQFKGKIELGTY